MLSPVSRRGCAQLGWRWHIHTLCTLSHHLCMLSLHSRCTLPAPSLYPLPSLTLCADQHPQTKRHDVAKYRKWYKARLGSPSPLSPLPLSYAILYCCSKGTLVTPCKKTKWDEPRHPPMQQIEPCSHDFVHGVHTAVFRRHFRIGLRGGPASKELELLSRGVAKFTSTRRHNRLVPSPRARELAQQPGAHHQAARLSAMRATADIHRSRGHNCGNGRGYGRGYLLQGRERQPPPQRVAHGRTRRHDII